jgi:hypothetical protein
MHNRVFKGHAWVEGRVESKIYRVYKKGNAIFAPFLAPQLVFIRQGVYLFKIFTVLMSNVYFYILFVKQPD